jgi:hypothetical protein
LKQEEVGKIVNPLEFRVTLNHTPTKKRNKYKKDVDPLPVKPDDQKEEIEELPDFGRYLILLSIEKINEKYIQVRSAVHGWEFMFVSSNWQVGYDFFAEFKENYNWAFHEAPDQEDRVFNSYIHLVQNIEKWKERKMKDDPDIKSVPSILCNVCKHRIDYNKCKAFPDGIPKELHNELHYTEHSSQKNDIVFELGEEGSKNAGIKPISNIRIWHIHYSPEYCDVLYDIKRGKREEQFLVEKIVKLPEGDVRRKVEEPS